MKSAVNKVPGAEEVAIKMSQGFCKLGSDEFCRTAAFRLEQAAKTAPKIK